MGTSVHFTLSTPDVEERISVWDGFRRAMLIAAAIAALGGLISWLPVRGREPRRAPRHPSPSHACTSCPQENERAVPAGAE